MIIKVKLKLPADLCNRFAPGAAASGLTLDKYISSLVCRRLKIKFPKQYYRVVCPGPVQYGYDRFVHVGVGWDFHYQLRRRSERTGIPVESYVLELVRRVAPHAED